MDSTPGLDIFSEDDIPVIGREVIHATKNVEPTPTTTSALPLSRSSASTPQPTTPLTPHPSLSQSPAPVDHELAALSTAAQSVYADNPHRQLVRQVIDQHQLNFQTPEAIERCVIAGETFLRGVRTEAQVRERLLLSHEHGGAGLAEADATTCLTALVKAADQLHSEPKRQIDDSRRAFVNKNAEAAHADVVKQGSAIDGATPRFERPVAVPVTFEKAPGRPVGRPPSSVTVVRPVDPIPLPSKNTGPLVSDVQFAPKIVGPIDELKSMTLEDFRRLSRHSRESAAKVLAKVETLGKQSYEHKRKGIDAWHAGPVNRLYLEYLRKVMSGTTPAAITLERRKAKLPILADEEFKELMNLSQKLRYE